MLTVVTRIGAAVSLLFGVQQFAIVQSCSLWVGFVNTGSALVFPAIRKLYRFGSGIGLQFDYVVAAAIVVLVLGIDHMVIALELFVPHNTGAQPDWVFRLGFIINTFSVWLTIIATVWFAMRETARAEQAMETEYARSERLLANILPATIAERLKDPERGPRL